MGRGPAQTFVQRMHTDGQHAHMKRCSALLIIGEMQSKPEWDVTSHLSDGKCLVYKEEKPGLGEDVEKRELLCTLCGL